MAAACVLTEQGAEQLKSEMNRDGAHIICGERGRISACNFFSSRLSQFATSGASGTAAAEFLSQTPGTVAIKISEDGSVKEFRDGKEVKQHCPNFPAPCKVDLMKRS